MVSNRRCRSQRKLAASFALLAAFAVAPAASARVDVSLDAESLTNLLSAMAPSRVDVALTEGRGVSLVLEDLRVTGFDPSEGAAQEGFVLTSLRLKVPELGIDLPVEPRLSLQVREKNGKKDCFLRFEKVPIRLAIGGVIDVAPLLPIMPLPTDTAWIVSTTGGDVRVRSQLGEAKMGAKNIRLSFDLDAQKVGNR